MTNSFDSKSLAEKLNKLNNSQQSIESLSSWCIAHRNKAKQVTETWDKIFNSPSKDSKELKVSLLYLANDILQNSRRDGCEFVNEFWKVLPRALKNLYVKGEDNEKSVILRLVGIWDVRKVFGSRGRGLKNGILYNENQPPSSLEINRMNSNSNPMKVVQKDTQTIRIKLAVGGMPEKIVTAYQSVLDFDEDAALNKCETSIHLVGKIAEDIDGASVQGSMQESALTNELQAHETILKQCIDQFRSFEADRASLVTYLREGLQEQESKLEQIRTQLLAAQIETERIINLKHKISSAPNLNLNPNRNPETTTSFKASQPVTYFSVPSTTSTKDEQATKAAAAAMAAKLAASSSSAQMLSSLLSSLVAEEAASKISPISPEKRQKLDNFHMPHQHPPHQHPPHQQLAGPTPLPSFPPPMPQYLQTPPFMFPGNSMQSPPQQPPMPPQQPPMSPQQPPMPPQQEQQALGNGYYTGNGYYGGQAQQAQSMLPTSRQQ